ncbi:hypothetical protein D046_2602B, partial [Vibrio parahaemolyticus V-223/04]
EWRLHFYCIEAQ